MRIALDFMKDAGLPEVMGNEELREWIREALGYLKREELQTLFIFIRDEMVGE